MLPVSNRGIDMKSLKLLLRFLTVGGLVLLLLIPLLMIRGVIQDRELYRTQAEARVSQSMAGPQQVVGPLRVVPWREERLVNALNEDGKPEVRRDVKEGYLLQTGETYYTSKPTMEKAAICSWLSNTIMRCLPQLLPC